MLTALLLSAQTICLTCHDGSGGGSNEPRISGNGRFVAFLSDDGHLDPNDSNATTDIFVADVDGGVLECLTCDLPGLGFQDARTGAISDNGRYVTFERSGVSYLYDRTLRTRIVVPNGAILSGDGRWLVYSNPTDGQVWIRSVRAGGDAPLTAESEACEALTVSKTGQFIVYKEAGRGYVIDRETGISEQIDDGSTQYFWNWAVSADGRYFLNQTSECGAMLYDRALGTTECYPSRAGRPAMSADGRYLVTAYSWSQYGCFYGIWDRELGVWNGWRFGLNPSVSNDGSRIAFTTDVTGWIYVRFR